MAGETNTEDQGKGKKPAGFRNLLDRWQKADDKTGTVPFALTSPIKKKKKSVMMQKNEEAIRQYKKTFAAKNFKEKTPTRGMSVYNKPAQLKNVFGAKLQDLSDFKSPVFKKKDSEVEMIRETIKKTFFFDDLNPAEMKAFLDAFEPTQERKGTKLIKQGDSGDYFYILGKGKVSYHVDGEIVGEAESGSSFGELALLYSCPRAATVAIESLTAQLFRVDQKTFRSLLQKQTKIMEAEKMRLLKSVNFLQDIGQKDMIRLGRAMKLKVFDAGDALFKKGDEGDAFYMVHEGEVKVTEIMVGSTKFKDTILKPGDYFGERALATHTPRVGNAAGLTRGTAFSIGRATFEKVLGKFSRVIMKSQDRRIMEGIELLQLTDLTKQQFEELSQLVTDKSFDAGANIFDAVKETKASLYLLREGRVQLAGKRNDVVEPGGYFGEDQLLLDTRQTQATGKRSGTKVLPQYSATALESCLVGVLTLSDCRTVFETAAMVDMDAVNVISEEKQGDDSDDELMAASLAPSASLQRVTTKQWLAKSSKEVLRASVKRQVPLEALEKHSVLGEGQFGEVWLVSAQVGGEFGLQHFALKIQKKEDPTRGNSVAAIKREIDVLRLMDHPYIVNLVHQYEDPDHLNILMGLVHGGELFDVIHTENEDGTWSSGLPEADSKFYAMVITDTLDYIHRKSFVFRDLKPENVLIDKDGYPVICDFGFTKFVTDKTYTLCGTPNYLSPEVIMNRGHNSSSDHWALGVLIYEMVAGENPFFYDGMPQMELFQCIVREKFYPLPDEVSDEAFYVIDELLEKDPTQRLGSLAGGAKDIIAKEWFQDLNLDDLRQKKFKAPFIPQNTKLDDLVERSSLQSSMSDNNNNAEGSYYLSETSAPMRLGSNTSSGVNLHGSSQLTRSSLLDDDDSDDE